MNTRRRRHPRLASCCLAGALAFAAHADPQSQQQQQQSQQQQQPGGPRQGGDHGMRPGGFPGFGRGPFDPSSKEYQEFREQLKAFCLQHSPLRWAEFEERIQRGAARGFRGQMSAKFRELQALEKSDPALHAIKVRMIEVEDVEYGLINELKNVDRADEKKVADLRARLREQDEKYVRLRFEERSHRIDRLAKILEDERRKLADDRKDTGRLVDERFADLEKQGPDFFFRYPRRPDEGPGTAPTTPPGGAPAPASPNN